MNHVLQIAAWYDYDIFYRAAEVCYEFHTDASLLHSKPMVAMAELFQWYEKTLQKKTVRSN